MTPPFGQNPFCHAPAHSLAGTPGSWWPVGFTLADIFDTYMNVKSFRFNVAGADGGGGAFGQSIGAAGVTKRRVNTGPVAPPGVTQEPGCTDVLHLRQSGVAVFRMDFSRTVCNARRSLFYPLFQLQFQSNGQLVSTRPFPGGGEAAGAIDFGRGITSPAFTFFSDTAEAFPVVLFGSVTVLERYDSINMARMDDRGERIVRLTGVTFEDVAAVKVGVVEVGEWRVEDGGQALVATVPADAPREPVTIFTGDGDVYFTREDFRPV